MRFPAAACVLRAFPARGLFGLSVLCCLSFSAQASVDCATLKPQAPVAPGNVLQGLPLASELAAPDAQVGSGVGFAQLFAEGTTVELVLARAKQRA